MTFDGKSIPNLMKIVRDYSRCFPINIFETVLWKWMKLLKLRVGILKIAMQMM